MDEEEIAERIQQANGWAVLGLYSEALEVLETLPPPEWGTGVVIAICLMICTGGEMWVEGMELAGVFTPQSLPGEREAAGRFYLAHAVHLLKTGEREQAKEQIGRLSRIWPEGRAFLQKMRAAGGNQRSGAPAAGLDLSTLRGAAFSDNNPPLP